jgi:hypothetical protein
MKAWQRHNPLVALWQRLNCADAKLPMRSNNTSVAMQQFGHCMSATETLRPYSGAIALKQPFRCTAAGPALLKHIAPEIWRDPETSPARAAKQGPYFFHSKLNAASRV